VVKLAPGTDLAALNARYGTRTRSVLLASRSIYLLESPIPAPSSGRSAKDKGWKKLTDGLLKGLDSDPQVVYAELNSDADTTEDDRFHYWPSGGPECTGSDPGTYLRQPAASQLQLDAVHRTGRGSGAIIAVLDTGVDLSHPALRDRIAQGGYDYVDDDRTPTEVPDGTDQDGDGLTDEGYGHGTFVAGIAALVAPDARILPARVLDSDGRGSIFAVAEAIFDATEAGADVINMSFGTSDHVSSHLVTDAIGDAHSSGVIVVGAAGNDGSGAKHYPASVAGVLSVGALAADGVRLAGFSDRGNWVQLAAPGERISSALPCGYGTWSGTSMAAPFVAGAAAVLGGSPVPDAGRRADGNGAKDDKGDDDKGDDDKGDDDKGGDGNNGRHRGQVLRAICEGAVKLHGVQVKAGAIDLRRSLRRIG
jgi:subtilisin family serine protease